MLPIIVDDVKIRGLFLSLQYTKTSFFTSEKKYYSKKYNNKRDLHFFIKTKKTKKRELIPLLFSKIDDFMIYTKIGMIFMMNIIKIIIKKL